MTTLTLPTPGADVGVWGAELNAALTALNAGKADASTVYDKTSADARFVRTVNGTTPDGSGNVTVTTGGGSAVTSVNGSTGAVTITPASIGARASATQINAATDITGLATVARSGLATDLDITGFSTPDNLVMLQNSDNTWPARTAGSVKLWFTNPGANVSTVPLSNGSTAGGGGMVTGTDILFLLPA